MDNDAMLQELKRSWDEVELYEDNHEHWLVFSGDAHLLRSPAGNLWFDSAAECLAAGVAFTEERKKQIAKVRADIAWLTDVIFAPRAYGLSARTHSGRIFAREQAALAELQRGMRGVISEAE